MHHRLLTLFALIVLAASTSIAGTAVPLLDPAPGDVIAPEPAALSSLKSGSVSREPVEFLWPLPTEGSADFEVTPHVQSSREYRLHATAGELAAGVKLYTTAPGAVVRINPGGEVSTRSKIALDPAGLELISPDGRRLRGGEGMVTLATAAQLKAAGAPFIEGTSAFRIAAGLGAGGFELRAPDLPAAGQAAYVVHVFEPDSGLALTATTAADTVIAGHPVTTTFALPGLDELQHVRAAVVAPDGHRTELELVGREGQLRALVIPDLAHVAPEGLWRIEGAVEGRTGGLKVLRDVHTALAVAAPTASLAGTASPHVSDVGLEIGIPVRVGTPGRYEVRAVLTGTDPDGVTRPLAIAHSAAWLNSDAELALRFDRELLQNSGLQAPYELRDLRLVDQGRMGLLHRQSRALVID